MDKNNLLGLLLMGAVIFGFMYINQPSEEEIAAAKKAQIEATQQNDSKKEEVVTVDTLTANHVTNFGSPSSPVCLFTAVYHCSSS